MINNHVRERSEYVKRRNASIVQDYIAGKPIKDLATEHLITVQRVYQILNEGGVRASKRQRT